MTHPVRTQTGATMAERLMRYMWLLWIVWLSFLVYPLNALYLDHPAPLRLVAILAAVSLFVGVYTWNIWRSFRRITNGEIARPAWPALAVLFVLALAMTLADRREWIELFIFIGVSMGPSFPPRQAVIGVLSLVLLMVVLGLGLHAGVGPAAQIALQAAVSGFAVIIVVRIVGMERELRVAREEIARLAVSEERLRFARDLHDLLGHSLSLIALKTELAGRLIGVAPDRAAAEIRDVESVARTALQEVREAVAGYRQVTLASELDGARTMMAAAGIDLHVEADPGDLPSASETALSWTVREGATNVIKHSRAHHCTIRLWREGDRVQMEMVDDGRGAPPEASGSGLSGLAERVQALGGRFEAGSCSGGFRLMVSLPVGQGARQAGEERSAPSIGASSRT